MQDEVELEFSSFFYLFLFYTRLDRPVWVLLVKNVERVEHKYFLWLERFGDESLEIFQTIVIDPSILNKCELRVQATATFDH